MFHESHPDLLRLLVDERHESLRRAAGASRLRREVRLPKSTSRRRHRAGPDR
jgi:hypothetical protein